GLDDGLAEGWRDPGATADTIAFLQYTSGSTGMPKGGILTHENLAHNLSLISEAMEFTPSTIMVSWLPPYHDMGLIGGILAPLAAGGGAARPGPPRLLHPAPRPLRGPRGRPPSCSGRSAGSRPSRAIAAPSAAPPISPSICARARSRPSSVGR